MSDEAKTTIRRVAAIDIGSVTVRLLIADLESADPDNVDSEADAEYVHGPHVIEVCRLLEICELGRGLSETGKLCADGLAHTLNFLQAASIECACLQVEKITAVATSAVRDASNASCLIEGAAEYGITIDVISGLAEADLAFAGASSGGAKGPADILVVDPGGGSTEFIAGQLDSDGQAKRDEARSLQMGSRRLTDLFLHSDPPLDSEVEACRDYIAQLCQKELAGFERVFQQVIAVAGTATTLAAVDGKIDPYQPALVQDYQLSRGQVDALLQLFCSQTTQERTSIVGLEPKRAAVIIAGTLIVEGVMDFFGCESLSVSDRDLLYGIILSA
ncbi:MAG: hypothetical protein FWE46_03795 [Coriobacteriia bacterium]|nr:hypothetical protein [Coriobacteriia bacterium]MCL2537399.1 hypothetical protein [Coriobacteriia bacterium]